MEVTYVSTSLILMLMVLLKFTYKLVDGYEMFAAVEVQQTLVHMVGIVRTSLPMKRRAHE